ncbi:MAG: branched-chain amino acid ABC transporter permease [Chitinispirillaceae bacterium]|nr:branched-chain amino acid ABC transporter permease [Chitinispirillaceae bacterium]
MEYFLHILVITGIYAILAASLNLIVGYTGLPSLGHAAFSCIGAYASALLSLRLGVSPWLALPLAAGVAAGIGALVGLPALRITGDYLALTTFGLGLIVYSIALNWAELTEGPMGLAGIPAFAVAGFQLSSAGSYLVLVAVMAALTYVVLGRIVDSPFGRVLRAIREDETATITMGKDVARYKIMVFIVGAFFAGVAGSLYAHYITYIDPSSFTVMESITILVITVFGGLGNMTGSFIGAAVLIVFPETLRFIGIPSTVAAPLRQMFYGLLLILLMVLRPQGIIGNYHFK